MIVDYGYNLDRRDGLEINPTLVSARNGIVVRSEYEPPISSYVHREMPSPIPCKLVTAGRRQWRHIVEANGDAVAMTTTIEASFGSRVMVRGFLLNNELTDFDFTPGTPNEVGPRKRPRSSMAPLMVFDADGRLQMLLGSPGGSMIINYVAKTLVAALDWKMDVQAAAAAPNFGSRNGPTLLERGTAVENLRNDLLKKNHPVEIVPLTSGVHAIERVPGGWRGGADPRREGIAAGR